MTLEAIRYTSGRLEVLDQLLLPHQSVYVPVTDTDGGWSVINKMQVLWPGVRVAAAVMSLKFQRWVVSIV